MAIAVEIPTILRNYTLGSRCVQSHGTTVGDLVTNLNSTYPGIGERLLEAGVLRRFVNVYLNDEDVRFLGGLDTKLSDGDTVTILPAVAGG